MAIANRFQPPADGAVPQEQFKLLAGVVDQLAQLPAYKPVQDAIVFVAAGDFRRLTPRATGQNVVVPAADATNIGKRITLLVETTLGVLRVRAVSGTINGATAFVLNQGYVTWIELVSNGNGKWFTPLVNPGTTSTINITPTTGALGVVDISQLQSGGVLTFQNVTEASIAGFTAKTDGFWFVVHVRDATTSDVLRLIENSGNTTTSIRVPDIRDLLLFKNDSVMLIYSNNRWRSVLPIPKLWLTGVDNVTWAAQQDNFTRGSAGVNRIRVTLTGNQNLTGVVPATNVRNGEILVIDNVDTVDTLTIVHDATSTGANRFLLPGAANMALGPINGATFAYDDTSSRWRCIGRS